MPWTRPDKRKPNAWLDRKIPLKDIAGFLMLVAAIVAYVTSPQQIRVSLLNGDLEPMLNASARSARRAPFPNCDAARAVGEAPVYVGEPGYGPHLDGDSDGIGCEPYYGR